MAKIAQEMIDEIVSRRQAGENQLNIAKILGLSGSTVNKYCQRAAASGKMGFRPVLDGFAIKQTATETTDENGDKVWVKQRPLGDEEFAIPNGQKLSGGAALIDPAGRIINQWVKYNEDRQVTQLTREAVMEAVAEWKGKSEILAPPGSYDSSRLAFYPTADRHLGLLAWRGDSERDWDLKIAESEILSKMAELIQLTPPTYTAIMLDLGDQFHQNDQSNATPASGNRLDVDGRFPKVAKAAIKLRRAEIEMALQHHHQVIYRGLRGNHDPEAQMWLSIGLEQFFENNPRVVIDTDPGDFWHYEFGNTFLFANHGHKTKPDALPGIMAADHPDIWGRTKHRYAFSGHIHKERSGEALKVRWETLRTATPADNYAHTHGWRSGHELTSITYCAETGQRHRQFIPV